MQVDRATARLARELAATPDVEGFLAANRHRFAPETVAQLKREVDRLVEIDPARAEPLALAAQRVGATLDDPVSRSYGDAALARVHFIAGRYPDAEALYRTAVERLEGAGRQADAAALGVQVVATLIRQGRATDALEVARRIRPALKRAGDRRALAQLDSNVGAVYMFLLEKDRRALPFFERARAVFEELGDARSAEIVDFNRATALLQIDRPYDALAIYDEIARRWSRSTSPRSAAHVSFHAAATHLVLGRYGDALRRFHAAREGLSAAGDAVLAGMAELWMAELYLRLNVIDEASDLAGRASELFRSVEGHEAEVARALSVRARVQARQGDPGGAADQLEESQALYERAGAKILAADVRLERAWLELSSGDAGAARALAGEAASVYRRAKLRSRGAWAGLALAAADGKLGRPGAGLRAAKAALRAAEKLGEPWLACRAEEICGELELELGRRAEGVASLERAVRDIERLRMSLRPGEVRAAFLGDKLAPYERLVALNLERGDAEGARAAFRYVEMAKSRALADLLGQYLAAPREDASARSALREQLSRRLEELSWYSSRIERESEKGEQRNTRLDAQLRGELQRCEQELASLYLRLEVEGEELAELFSLDTADSEALAEDLAEDEALVEFFVAGDSVSAFVVTRQGLRAFPNLASHRGVERQLLGLRFQLEKFGLGSRYASAHAEAMRRCADSYLSSLYDALIAPLAEEIEGRRLVIVPHGLLHYLPVHALLAPDCRYVIETNEVSYCPSATVFRLCARREPARLHERALLAVGLADQKAPHIRAELEALSRLFPDSVLLEGGRADKAAFLDLAPRARYVHLATHGHFRQDNPMFSSVRLADAPLNFYDVFDLGMGAELVTLSACNTGVNGVAPGDELCGLMRGFLHAGTPSLIVSLWAVHDRSTSELMQGFYARLRAGAAKREALRAAQLEVLERYGHPYYWAPFVLMGKA